MKYLLKDKIIKLTNLINSEIIEKELVIKLSLLGIFSGESMFLLGPPGIGKSLISRKIASVFSDSKSFEILMNKFTLPEEIFGPIDIMALKEGSFKRKTDHYLPKANFAFLDEIWKSSSSIQNTLLTIINEKIFVNDGVNYDVNLNFLISASNELPERKQGLEALWDRFSIRLDLENIQDDKLFLDMVSNQENVMRTSLIKHEDKLSLDLINLVGKDIKESIKMNDEINNFILTIRKEINDKNNLVLKSNPFADGFDQYYVSDRKWKKIVGLLQTSAYLNERNKMDLSDVNMLPYTLWNETEQFAFYEELIYNTKFKMIYASKEAELLKDLESMRTFLINGITKGTVKEKVAIKEINHKNSEDIYYKFTDKDEKIYYFLKKEMDSIFISTDFSLDDWVLNYLTYKDFEEENFNNFQKAVIKYVNGKFYIIETDSDQIKKNIEIFTLFINNKFTEYEIISLTEELKKRWEEYKKMLFDKLDKIRKEMDMEINNLSIKNIFWDYHTKDLEAKYFAKWRDRFNEFRSYTLELEEEMKDLKIGFKTTNLKNLLSLDKIIN